MRVSAPIRLRLTLWYVLLLAVVLAIFIAAVYLVLRQTLYSSLDSSIQNQAGALLDAIEVRGGRPSLGGSVSGRPSEDAEFFARLYDVSRELTFDNSAGMGSVPEDASSVSQALAGTETKRRFKANGDQVRATVIPVERDGRIVGALEVGQAADDVVDTLSKLLLIMGLAYPVALAVASFGGVFLAGRALSPVDRVTRLARRISAERLDERLDLELPDDEIGRLARTFDEMIARLDAAFERQRRFTADASHELRTPLTVMKGQIDVALQQERDPENYREVLREVNEEVDRLVRLAGSLLTLTRADAGEITMVFESVDVAETVAGAVDHARATAQTRGIDLRVVPEGSVAVPADEGLLLQLLLNLLDNATKYTPAGGEVTVGWSVAEDSVELWVSDDGVGIPEEHIPFVFDRFYRVDKARSRADGGVGLGLAITRWIAEAHGGSIGVESAPGKGSSFKVRLPLA